tara:strand:+ start:240 stop:1679 length:1440 start_codon:yes stop_codon:yes gene_type:complete
LNKNFLINTSLYFSVNIFVAIGSLLILPIYTSYLSPEDWGYIAIFLFFGPTIVALVSLGLPQASYYFYFKIKDEDEYNTLQSTNFFALTIIYLITGFLIYFFSNFISLWLFNDNYPGKLLVLSYFSGCFQMLSMNIENILTGQGRSKAFSSIVITRFFSSSILSLHFIVFSSMTFMGRINGLFISNVICFLLALVLLRNNFKLIFSINTLKKSIKFSYPELPLSLFNVIVSSLDKVLLTNLRGLESLGQFNFGARFVDILMQVPNAVRRSWNPFFFESTADKKQGYKEIVSKRFEQLVFLLAIPGILVVIFSEDIINIFGGNQFILAKYIIPIYVFTYFFHLTDFLSSNQIISSEKLTYLLPSAFIGGIASIALNLILISRYGALGAALAASLHFLIGHLINLHYGNKLTPFPVNKIKILSFFFILFIISILTYFLIDSELSSLIKLTIKILSSTFLIILTLIYSELNFKSIKSLFRKE